jgi:hypothetical protein
MSPDLSPADFERVSGAITYFDTRPKHLARLREIAKVHPLSTCYPGPLDRHIAKGAPGAICYVKPTKSYPGRVKPTDLTPHILAAFGAKAAP